MGQTVPHGHKAAVPGQAGPGLLHLTCETLALGCLFERRGAAFIRVPVHRRQQMLGCEWHSRRIAGLLRAVSYTFEALEDWTALAQEAPRRVAALYRGILGRPEIRDEDLVWRSDVYARRPDGHELVFPAGSYNPLNAWNTVRGAVHLNGGAMAGFEAMPRPDPGGRLRLSEGPPERGLLFLGGRDVTAEVLRPARREGPAGPPRRLEAAVPEEADWSLCDLSLPNGERFTPLGLFHALLGGNPAGGPGEEGEASGRGLGRGPGDPWALAGMGSVPLLPGRLVTEALLRQAGLPPVRS
ncbi:hypothetical protein [Roseomonas indoligenes]|uniref:Uncharacterized protein n=1 Tax=Roseomonas indoligenes TaxID=2820811 RepID=A0A940S7B4_9PROT|nr:hypothetical protein [Pararoseomonas indoligenes]MBP0496451.1 hypothetical protein [Pararoseomonas indoligenes]